MSDSTQTFSKVRIKFDPYSHSQVQKLLSQVVRDFGHDKTRWYYRSVDPVAESIENNVWILDFCFRDPHDAMMFGLKYSR